MLNPRITQMNRLLIAYISLLAMGTIIYLPFFGKEIQFVDLFFVFILVSVIWNLKKGAEIKLFKPPLPIKGLLLTMSIMLLVSCVFSANPTKSLLEYIAILYLLILYLWVGGLQLDNKNLASVLHFWLYISGVLCILALGGFFTYIFTGNSNLFIQIYPEMKSLIPYIRVTSTFPTMNMFASFLHVGTVFLLTLIISYRWRLTYILLTALFFICLFLTASRNIFGIIITIFLAVLPLRGKASLSVFKYAAFCLCVMLFFWVLITTTWYTYPAQINHDRQNNLFNLSINTTPSLYNILNRVSIRLIKQHYITGVGPGMFNDELAEHLDWEEAKNTYRYKGYFSKDASVDPHNTYLGWAAEAGLPFIAAIIGLFYFISRLIWKASKAYNDSFKGNFCYICMCGIVGFMVNGFYIDILTMRHFWIMVGLGTLVAMRCNKPKDSSFKDI